MKRSIVWGIGAGSVVVVAVLALRIGNPESGMAIAANKKTATPPPSPVAPPPEEKVAYTFKDESDVQGFTAAWQQRQATLMRMTVLKAYWDEEQARLDGLNAKITTDYKLDPTKNYVLDAKRRVLVERELPPVAAPANPPAQSSTPAPEAPAQDSSKKPAQ